MTFVSYTRLHVHLYVCMSSVIHHLLQLSKICMNAELNVIALILDCNLTCFVHHIYRTTAFQGKCLQLGVIEHFSQ